LFLETEKGIFEAILEGKLDLKSPPWPSISTGAKDLISKMLTMEPKKRITAAEALGEYIILKRLTDFE
jgi:calcium-dependent protein kinase